MAHGCYLIPRTSICVWIPRQGFGEHERGITHLREATSGSLPEPGRLARQKLLVQGREGGAHNALFPNRGTSSTMPLSFEMASGDIGGIARAGDPSADRAHIQKGLFSEDISTCHASSVCPSGQASTDRSLHTPKKTTIAGSKPRAGDGILSGSGFARAVPPVMMPRTPRTATAEKVRHNTELKKRGCLWI